MGQAARFTASEAGGGVTPILRQGDDPEIATSKEGKERSIGRKLESPCPLKNHRVRRGGSVRRRGGGVVDATASDIEKPRPLRPPEHLADPPVFARCSPCHEGLGGGVVAGPEHVSRIGCEPGDARKCARQSLDHPHIPKGHPMVIPQKSHPGPIRRPDGSRRRSPGEVRERNNPIEGGCPQRVGGGGPGGRGPGGGAGDGRTHRCGRGQECGRGQDRGCH